MGLFSWSVIIIFFWLAINAGLILRWRIFIGKWPSRKVLIWSNIIMIMVLIIYEILPKSNGKCKVDIIIDNRNSNSEIVINRCYNYHLTDNKTIELFDLEPHGQIGIKTQNEAKFILFSEGTHLFNYKHKIRILIYDNKIAIKNISPLDINTIIEGIEKYDNIYEKIIK
jgi:hypothetical protein